ncbi:MAG: ABC transporter permease subunit, partial [Geminicoccales bacterium]
MEGALTLALDTANYVLVIALVATSPVVIFSLMNVINLAHGELFLLGAYTLLLAERIGLGFWAGLVLAPLAVGIVGGGSHPLALGHRAAGDPRWRGAD